MPESIERRAYRIDDLPSEVADAIEKSAMDSSHSHLNALLDRRERQAMSGVIVLLIGDKLEEIRKLCRLHDVCKLEAFGSVMRQDFDPRRSDIDMLVEFYPRLASSFANFLALKDALEGLLGRRVDLFELRAIRNRRLRRHIEESKSPVYVSPPDAAKNAQ
jgi:uncharacterized protein